jgi:hypothetical protein
MKRLTTGRGADIFIKSTTDPAVLFKVEGVEAFRFTAAAKTNNRLRHQIRVQGRNDNDCFSARLL